MLMLLQKLKSYVSRFLWFYVPYDKEVRLKYYLSHKFRKRIQEIRNDFSIFESVPVHKKPGKKLCLVFLSQGAASWSQRKTIYEAAKRDKDVEVYVLAVPAKIIRKHFDVNHEEYEPVNRAYEMFSKFEENTIGAYDYDSKTWFDLKSLEPDYVFFPRPYDMHLPPCYRSDEVKKYAKICFNAYCYVLPTWGFKRLYQFEFIRNCSLIFAQSEYHKTIIKNVLAFLHAKDIKVDFLGFPRFELLSNYTQCGGGKTTEFKKTVVWLPRWATKDTDEATTFFKYKDSIVKYFLEHKDIKLICRPHLLMFNYFLSEGIMTQSEIEVFLKPFHEEKNFVFDNDPDYLPSLTQADIFISDFTSLLIEETIINKPVIYTGRTVTLSKEAKDLAKLFYTVSDEAQLFRNLEALIDNHDNMKQERHEYIENRMKNDSKAGERIMNFIKEDFNA